MLFHRTGRLMSWYKKCFEICLFCLRVALSSALFFSLAGMLWVPLIFCGCEIKCRGKRNKGMHECRWCHMRMMRSWKCRELLEGTQTRLLIKTGTCSSHTGTRWGVRYERKEKLLKDEYQSTQKVFYLLTCWLQSNISCWLFVSSHTRYCSRLLECCSSVSGPELQRSPLQHLCCTWRTLTVEMAAIHTRRPVRLSKWSLLHSNMFSVLACEIQQLGQLP